MGIENKHRGVVQLGGYGMLGDFFLFELGGVILGVAWLATLGEVKVNWKALTMKFVDKGEVVEVKGDPSLSKALISPQALMKVTEIEGVSMLWGVETECCNMGDELQNDLPEDEMRQLQQVLEDFAQVFSEPEGLPPNRNVDHRIPIKAGVDPVNVCPYRYPHLQQNEIEKQVADMLASGIIRPAIVHIRVR